VLAPTTRPGRVAAWVVAASCLWNLERRQSQRERVRRGNDAVEGNPAKHLGRAGDVKPNSGQAALMSGTMRLVGGMLTPNPTATQINPQNTWTQQAI
jgi:hypothetical protein